MEVHDVLHVFKSESENNLSHPLLPLILFPFILALRLASGMDGWCNQPGKHATLEVEHCRRSESWEALSSRPLDGQSAPPGVALRPASGRSREELC